jgi:predicted nucleic acid-binding protein
MLATTTAVVAVEGFQFAVKISRCGETFQRQTRTRLSFVDTAVVNVARNRADGLVATFDRELTAVRGIQALPA